MRLRALASLVVLSGSGLFAFASSKDGWKQKDFKQWTDQDAQMVMTDSPWAKQVPMPAGGRPQTVIVEPGANGAAPPSASLGNPSNSTTGNNMSVAANPGSAGPADPNGLHSLPTAQTQSAMSPSTGAPEPHSPLTIVWASATPVRLAILKLRSGVNTPTESEIENATKPRKNYVIAVSGLPAPDRDFDAKAAARNASLSFKGTMRAVANEVLYRKIGNSDVYFFHFDRESFSIPSDTGVLEFKMQLGKIDVKRKFNMAEMRYQGHLAL